MWRERSRIELRASSSFAARCAALPPPFPLQLLLTASALVRTYSFAWYWPLGLPLSNELAVASHYRAWSLSQQRSSPASTKASTWRRKM